jgi:hypothetical protein
MEGLNHWMTNDPNHDNLSCDNDSISKLSSVYWYYLAEYWTCPMAMFGDCGSETCLIQQRRAIAAVSDVLHWYQLQQMLLRYPKIELRSAVPHRVELSQDLHCVASLSSFSVVATKSKG